VTPKQHRARRAAAPPRSASRAGSVQPVLPVRALRSWLFVPGDSERKQEKALASTADAVILDLEDSVEAAQLPAARTRVAQLLRARSPGGSPQLFVRVNAPVSGLLRADVEAVFAGGVPDGIVLPKVAAAREVIHVARRLAVLEQRSGGRVGRTRLLIIATETPMGVLSLPQYPAILGAVRALRERIAGLTWGGEDLSAALGARSQRDAAGALTFTFELARTQCLLAAAALGVQAIDGVCTEFRDPARLQHELEAARRDGFTGKLAIHPDQIAAINAAFAPTDAEREHAERVVAAFATAPAAGVVSLDGRMIDRPHLLQAQRILAVAQRARDGT
jgi:citrate lyase subunit beta/citryl-CoA lyase